MKVLIAGAPKTGTTGLYFKVKNSTPDTGALGLFEPAFYVPSKSDERRGVVAKILIGAPYEVDLDSWGSFDKKIVLVRDPRDWLISGLLYYAPFIRICHSGADEKVSREIVALLQRKERDPKSISVLDIIDSLRTLWSRSEEQAPGKIARACRVLPLSGDVDDFYRWRMQLMTDFLHRYSGFHAVKYEDFVSGRAAQDLEEYLGFPVLGKSDVTPDLQRVVRTKGSGDWRNWFLPRDIEFFKPIFAPFMSEFGYPDDWTLPENPAISAHHASANVQRNIVEAKIRVAAEDPAQEKKLVTRARDSLSSLAARVAPGPLISAGQEQVANEIAKLDDALNYLTHQLKQAQALNDNLAAANARTQEIKAKLETTKEKVRTLRDENLRLQQSVSWRFFNPAVIGALFCIIGILVVHAIDRKKIREERLSDFRAEQTALVTALRFYQRKVPPARFNGLLPRSGIMGF